MCMITQFYLLFLCCRSISAVILIVHDQVATGRVPATRPILFLVPELVVMEASHYRGMFVCLLCVCVCM